MFQLELNLAESERIEIQHSVCVAKFKMLKLEYQRNNDVILIYLLS
jgi:hypothetical protein